MLSFGSCRRLGRGERVEKVKSTPSDKRDALVTKPIYKDISVDKF